MNSKNTWRFLVDTNVLSKRMNFFYAEISLLPACEKINGHHFLICKLGIRIIYLSQKALNNSETKKHSRQGRIKSRR